MDQVLEGADLLKCYIDDVLLHSKGFLQHLVHREEVFKRLHEVNMKIHPKKCEFVITSIVYLGQRILPNGIMAHWAKVAAILEMPNLIDVHTLRSFSDYVITTKFLSKTLVLLVIFSMHC
jgi:hypothetical protein